MASFEQELDELEKVVEQLERGDLSLEESVDLFERGVLLSRSCKAVLNKAESRIQALVDPEDDGPVRVEEIGMAIAEEEDDEVEEDFEDSEDGE
jgi:exodeoxyribonuclease VII small subunit